MHLFPHSLKRRLTEKYEEVMGGRQRVSTGGRRHYEELREFQAMVMKRLKRIYDERSEDYDERNEEGGELRDLYFQYKDEKVI